MDSWTVHPDLIRFSPVQAAPEAPLHPADSERSQGYRIWQSLLSRLPFTNGNGRPQRPIYRVDLYLIKPSNYDDDGYVVRYYRGVLPSNTLACLATLTDQALKSEALAGIRFRTHLIDETVSWVDCKRISQSQKPETRTIVALVGVQTNQFPRAADLAKSLLARKVTVILGGFHISGSLAMLPGTPPEIQELVDLGATVVGGEVEERWGKILEDAVFGCLSPVYDFTGDPRDLDSAPLPELDTRVV